MFQPKLPALALGAALLSAVALGAAPALVADEMPGKMMDDTMMGDKMMSMSDPAMMKMMMMDKMMAGMSKGEKKMMSGLMMMRAGEVRVPMMTSPPAANAGLQDATGFADVNVAGGMVEIVVFLPEGKALPAGSVLEGWLSSAGRKGGPGPSTASDADQKFGPAFGMAELSKEARDVPYALSTGLLRRIGNTQTYYGHFMIDNPLTPYAAVAITVESDGNVGNYDPRPGSPLMAGMIGMGMMMGKDGKMMAPRLMMMMPDGRLVPLQMLKGKMMMSMPSPTTPGVNVLTEIKMMDGKMMAMDKMLEGKMVMVMPDGTRRDVMMQDGKMMMTEPDGSMSEIMMMP